MHFIGISQLKTNKPTQINKHKIKGIAFELFIYFFPEYRYHKSLIWT